MQIQMEIGFDQLIQLVKKLPQSQWNKLKLAVEKTNLPESKVSEMETFLLTAPTFSETQLQEIDNARNELSKWRKK